MVHIYSFDQENRALPFLAFLVHKYSLWRVSLPFLPGFPWGESYSQGEIPYCLLHTSDIPEINLRDTFVRHWNPGMLTLIGLKAQGRGDTANSETGKAAGDEAQQ